MTVAAAVEVGALGVWSLELRAAPPSAAAEAAAELHEQGWGAIWVAGAGGAGIWGDAERLLAAGTTAAVALGVVSIWGADAEVAAVEHARLREAHGPRLLSGFGVSSAGAAAAAGHRMGSPVGAMGAFLDGLDSTGPPLPAGERLLAALGPRMTSLAGQRSAGVHPFLVTPGAVAASRALLGPAALVAPQQAVVLEGDPGRAREVARQGIGMYLGFPSYRASLRRQGFTDADLVPGGSDRLLDALVVHGGLDAVADRVREHWAAGADHVALQVLTAGPGLPRSEWRELAALRADLVPAPSGTRAPA